MKISLDKKILIGFIMCSVIILVVTILSVKNSEKFLNTNYLVNHTHEVLYELEQILINSVDAETGVRGFIITGSKDYLEPFDNSKLKIYEHLGAIKELTKDNPIQQKNIVGIESLIDKRLKVLETSIELRKIEGFEKTREHINLGEGKRLQDEIRKIIGQSKDLEQRLLGQRKQVSEDDARSFNLIFVALICVIIAVLVVVYFIVLFNLKALRHAQAEIADRNWNLEGSSDLIKNMQGNKRLSELAQIIINQLATALNMQAGALYIIDDANTILTLEATYCLDKYRSDLLVLRFGEGVAGQAAAGKQNLFVSQMTSDNFHVKTGFGEIIPKNIMAIPIIFERRVVAVIELASTQEFTNSQKKFMDIVIDSIATCITSAQARKITHELLEETQRQAEEMETQQEELRQSNEELLSKTELLENSEIKLKIQQEELRRTNEELKDKASLLEEQNETVEKAKQEVETKANELEMTSKYKSDFLANMSHELRTPLNSILILAQILSDNKNETLTEKETDFAKNIFNSGTDLLNLIDEILDLSKIEAGKMQLEIEDVNFSEIIDNIQAIFSEIAKSKSINFKIDFIPDGLPTKIVTDEQRLKQILKNLLSNAFKFTPKGGHVTLTIKKSSSVFFIKAGLESFVTFSVSDTGIGIPKAKRELIFEAFQQADGSTKRKYGGTGLGLSICRELSYALGGEIQLQSEEGEGSTFTLYLPLKFDSSSINPVQERSEVTEFQQATDYKTIAEPVTYPTFTSDDRYHIAESDRIVLIIEDEISFALVILNFVRERNYKGVIASQTTTGLTYARHYKPNIILLDLKPQGVEGLDVLRQLKKDPDLRHIPIQIISAHDQRKKALELGAFDYLTKPVTATDLDRAFDRIEKFINNKPKKLLVIEDSEFQNKAICELIGGHDNVKCFSAYRADEALKKIDVEIFDGIILDLGLPDMSGNDLLEKIKSNTKLNGIPIIIYTGKELTKTESLLLDKFANTIILKTANSHERLLDETILLLHCSESQLPKEKQVIIRNLHKEDGILKHKKILLVDDDIRNIYSLTNALGDEGIQCITADNGKAALKILEENDSTDLILMDIMMPEMDGYETTIEIRKLDKFNKLPIIALTAKAMKGDKEKCLAVGMSDYISKPVNIEKLISLLRLWLYR